MERGGALLAHSPGAVRWVAATALVVGALACGRSPDPTPVPSPAPSGTGRTITLAQLEASLASLPRCTVVFDIDDTTLYTGLAFLFAQGYLEERDAGKFREDRAFDRDGDIADTHEADPAIRAIRIIRSPVSYNERPVLPGKYGEEILANSAD